MAQPSGKEFGVKNIINKFFDWLTKDYDVSDQKDVIGDDGSIIGTRCTITTARGLKIHAKFVKTANRAGLYDLYLLDENGNKGSYPHTTEDKLDDNVERFLQKYYDDQVDSIDEDDNPIENDFDVSKTFDNDVESSTKLQIQASKNLETGEYKLHSVYANYDAPKALDDINEVLAILDEEDDNPIGEEPVCLEIIPEENAYGIDVIDNLESIAPCTILCNIVQQQYELLFLIDKSYSDDFALPADGFFTHREYFKEVIRMQLDFMLSSHFNDDTETFNAFDILKRIDFDSLNSLTSSTELLNLIDDYASTLDFYYPLCDHEIQHLFDEWLLTLRYLI